MSISISGYSIICDDNLTADKHFYSLFRLISDDL